MCRGAKHLADQRVAARALVRPGAGTEVIRQPAIGVPDSGPIPNTPSGVDGAHAADGETQSTRVLAQRRRWANPSEIGAAKFLVPPARDSRLIQPSSVLFANHSVAKANLALIALADHLIRLRLRAIKGRQQHAREDGNNCDHDQQLDQGERDGGTVLLCGRHCRSSVLRGRRVHRRTASQNPLTRYLRTIAGPSLKASSQSGGRDKSGKWV